MILRDYEDLKCAACGNAFDNGDLQSLGNVYLGNITFTVEPQCLKPLDNFNPILSVCPSPFLKLI